MKSENHAISQKKSFTKENMRAMSKDTYEFLRNYSSHYEKGTYAELSNEEILEAYQLGKCPFEAVMHRYHGLLIKMSRQWVPGYTQEDLFQEMAFKLYSCCSKWDPKNGQKFITYLYASLENVIALIIRKGYNGKQKANSLESASYDVMLENGYDEEAPDSLELDWVELLEDLNLSDREKLCVEMIIEGRQKAEIADKLKVTRTRVGQIIKGMAPKFQFLITQ